ncbi:MAG: hypothetical protein GC161_02440 [Planctomycetaceae bacterium]|nr:hypothetical protein [Planctomycetaceae bacterium]
MPTEPSASCDRRPPIDRAAVQAHRFDLREVAQFLHREKDDARRGHRQAAVYLRGPTSMSLLSFEAGGVLADQSLDGLAILHCVDGRIEVETDAAVHVLESRQLVVLDRHVRHSVRAAVPSEMLLTVHLDREAHDPA